jgi:hypothetical protein
LQPSDFYLERSISGKIAAAGEEERETQADDETESRKETVHDDLRNDEFTDGSLKNA